jgi:hypothetical protein
MTLVQIREMLLWCSIINLGMLVLFFLAFVSMGSFICRMHGKLWKMPEEKVRMSLYSIMAMYKVLIFLFNVIPYIALRIIG